MIRGLMIFGALVLFVTRSASSQSDSPGHVKIALLKSMVRDVSPQKVDAMAANFKTVLKDLSGLDGEMVVVPSVDDLWKQLNSGDVQLGAFYGFEFAWMNSKHPELEPLMLSAPDPDRLRALLVVAKDDPAKSITDLRGKKFAMTNDTSENSRLFLDRLCKKHGATIEEMFSTIDLPITTEDGLDNLVDHTVQVVLIDRAAFKMFERRKPARFAKLRVLGEMPPFPPSVLAFIRGKVSESTLKAFRDGMNNTDKSVQGKHLMVQMRIKRFEPVPAGFEKQLAAILKEYPPP